MADTTPGQPDRTPRPARKYRPSQEAGPVVKRYIRIATATRPYFQATKDSPVDDFVAEADRHPVFELRPVASDRRDNQRER